MPLLARLRTEGYTEYFGFFHATGGAAAITPFARQRWSRALCRRLVRNAPARRLRRGRNRLPQVPSRRRWRWQRRRERTSRQAPASSISMSAARADPRCLTDGSRAATPTASPAASGSATCASRHDWSPQLPLDDYIALLNRYFDVTVGAVMACGRRSPEVHGRRRHGDLPLGSPGERHRYAGTRAGRLDAGPCGTSQALDAPGRPLKVGIALHVGEVMYGNVGTDERLDFTVIGRAVNEAARLQGLTKQLGHPVLASASFVETDSRSLRLRRNASGRRVWRMNCSKRMCRVPDACSEHSSAQSARRRSTVTPISRPIVTISNRSVFALASLKLRRTHFAIMIGVATPRVADRRSMVPRGGKSTNA